MQPAQYDPPVLHADKAPGGVPMLHRLISGPASGCARFLPRPWRRQRRRSTIFRPPGRGRRPAHGREARGRGRRRALGRQRRVRDDGQGPERPALAVRVDRRLPQASPGSTAFRSWARGRTGSTSRRSTPTASRYAFDMDAGQRPRRASRFTASSATTDQWKVVEVKADDIGGVGDEPPRVLSAIRCG